MKEILKKNIHHHAPIVTKNVRGKRSPWLTRELKVEMNRRDALHRKFLNSKSAEDFDAFKKQRNKVNVRVRKAKNQHSRSMLIESASNPNRFWKALKNIFSVKEKASCSKMFLINNVLTTDTKKIAAGFCSFFTNVANHLKTKSLHLKNFVWARPAPTYPKTYNTFRFKEVAVAEVLNI